MSDKRSSLRSRSFLSAKIIYNHGACTVDCVVRNLSETGAKLKVSEAVTIPQHFELLLGHGHSHRAAIRWRSGEEVGVAFLDAASSAATAPAKGDVDELHKRIADLEQENARLRALIEAAMRPDEPLPTRRKIA